MTLDLTVNPDFGQVEADLAQIALDGFEIFLKNSAPSSSKISPFLILISVAKVTISSIPDELVGVPKVTLIPVDLSINLLVRLFWEPQNSLEKLKAAGPSDYWKVLLDVNLLKCKTGMSGVR